MNQIPDTPLITVSILVRGRVQGVYYRQSSKEKAIQLGITGRIKNNPDQTVEIIATGDESKIAVFVEWCRQGPPRAIVDHIECRQLELRIFTDYVILR